MLFPIGVGKAERVLYLPSAGFCLLVGAFAGMAERRVRRSVWLYLLVLSVLVGFSVRTYVRNADWRDDLTLALATLKVSPAPPLFNRIAGVEYRKRGEWARSEPFLRAALRAKPEYYGDSYVLGNNSLDLGKYDEAIGCYRRALELRPGYLGAMNYLGRAYMPSGRITEAIATFTSILARDRRYLNAYLNLGTVYLHVGEPDRADSVSREGLSVLPDAAGLHFNRAVTLNQLGRLDEAGREQQRAVALDPGFGRSPF